MSKLKIDEGMKLHEDWYKDAKGMTLEKLPEFLRHLTEDYEHDYGTVCHAIAAASVATGNAVNRSPGSNGGITGFQAGAVMWEFIKNWQYGGEYKPLKLMDFSEMLYPQYVNNFTEKTINKHVWSYLQEEAKKLIATATPALVNDKVKEHWQSIVDGVIPFGYTLEEEED